MQTPLVENNIFTAFTADSDYIPQLTADSDDDDDWSAYFSSLGMPDMMEEPMLPKLVIAPLVVPPLVVPPLVVPMPPLVENRRRGRVPIDPLTSTEEAILAGLIAASPENKVKIRQRYMSKRRVRARLGM